MPSQIVRISMCRWAILHTKQKRILPLVKLLRVQAKLPYTVCYKTLNHGQLDI